MPRNPSENSIYLEKALNHIFLGSILQYMWKNELSLVEIYTSEIDNNGFDIILSTDNATRYIQVKATNIYAVRSHVDINTKLSKKTGGCIVWLFYDPATLEIVKYYYFGGEVGEYLPDITYFKTAQHTRKNADGKRPYRKNTKLIPKKYFTQISDIALLVDKLFNERIKS